MKLTIIKFLEGSRFSDPLHNYLSEWAELLASEQMAELPDLDSIFRYLVHQMEEFIKANPKYKKPAGLHLVHNKPSCCPATLKIEYRNEFITLKTFIHETNPDSTLNADVADKQPTSKLG